MTFGVVTLFPESVRSALGFGVIGRALEQGHIAAEFFDPRSFADDERGTVDDRPFGGGPGMVLIAEIMERSLLAAKERLGDLPVWYPSPQGEPLRQSRINHAAQGEGLIVLCGRYEGIDERLVDKWVDYECAVGDFVVSGGEIPAAMLIDAVARQVPGVLGKSASADEDSFMDGLLDCPHTTRPEVWDGRPVPDVLTSGHHGKVEQWRRKQSLGRTWLRRPDLLGDAKLNKADRALLKEFIEEYAAR